MQAQSSPQSQSNTTPNQPSTSLNQTTTQSQAVTLKGCVYRMSDQPDVFALERMPPSSSSTATGATGTSGTPDNSSATERRTGWLRLTPRAADKLSQYDDQAVQVTGTVRTPQEQNGGEIVVHEVRPNKVTVTTIDLRPAPELRIQSITATQGTCGGDHTANN